MVIAVALALLAALSSAGGDVAQRVAARSAADGHGPLLRRLAHRGGWWLGVGGSLLGFALHLGALSLGAVSAVQPITTMEMPLALVGIALVFRRPLGRGDVLGVLAAVAGLLLVVGGLAPTGGDRLGVPGVVWALGVGATLAVVAVLAVAGARADGDVRAGFWGAAGGVCYGLTGALFAVTGRAGGLAAALGSWQTWAAVACGLTAFALIQNAFGAGKLLAVEPGLTLGNPLVATVWGLAVFGETARTGAGLVAAVAGTALLALGVVRIARSPLLDHHAAGRVRAVR